MTNNINNINKIKIINVGQGDSFILSPNDSCIYKNVSIFIDVGDGGRDVFKYANTNEIILVLSHSHMDHMGGLIPFFKKNEYSKLLKEIWLPMYYDEICNITRFILGLNGIQSVSNDNGNYIKAKTIVSASYLLDSLSKSFSKPIKIKGLYHGRRLCDEGKNCKHINVYNPPICPESVLGLEKEELDKYIFRRKEIFATFEDWFPKNYYNELRQILDENPKMDRENIHDNFPQLIGENDLNFENRRRFIYGMFFKLKEQIANFVEKPNNGNFNKIFNTVKLTSNDSSIVFKYVHENLDVLFTGDSGKEVFNRLIKNKSDIKSNILKIPHHGSKKNINKAILKYIDPSFAIVSHGNGKFGKQRDPHPNKEVIRMLKDSKIETIYTNDVIKEKTVIRKPDKSFVNSYLDYIDDE